MHNPESVQENQKYKILWNFEIQTDPSQLENHTESKIKRKKGTCQHVYFTIPTEPKVEIKKSEKINKYLDRTRELE